jgi:hypothetical protein
MKLSVGNKVKNLSESAIIIPTRTRSHKIDEIIRNLETTKTKSDLYFCCDLNDKQLLRYLFKIRITYRKQAKLFIFKKIRKRTGVVGPLNFASRKLIDKYKYMIFLGDDHQPITIEWDTKIINSLKHENKYLGYPNDLHRKGELPTSVALNSKFVKIVNGFGPHNLTHLYVDDFWLQVGLLTNSIMYFPDVIVRHNHPVIGLQEWDRQYRLLNSEQYYRRGEE